MTPEGEAGDQEVAQPSDFSEQTPPEKQPRVLIVDDEPDIRDLLGMMLSKRGFKVTTAENGFDALGKIEGMAPDVLLLDISMPKMNGIELLRFANDLGVRIPVVIALSGVASEEQIDETLGLGATDFFAKPLDLESLISCIRLRLGEAEASGAES